MEFMQPRLLARQPDHLVRRFRPSRTLGVTQWSASSPGEVILIGFHSNFAQVPAGVERGQDQRRDHVEPLRTGYEVRHGRSVKARSSDGRLGADRRRMNDSKLTGDAAGN